VVPAVVYYGLRLLTPRLFRPSAVLVCAAVSMALGSWGTAGTVGLALMGIASAMGIPLPLAAGAVISGAYVGDKLSPMADITLLRRRLKGVREVHIVSVDGECKELLLQLSAGEEETCQLTVTELSKSGTATLRFGAADKETRCPGLESASLREGNWLFEPGAALLKSACHDAACHRAGLRKLAPSTHLYIAGSPDAALAGFGRFRQILDILPLDRHAMKEAGKRYPAAGVTARNIPMHSDELARRLGIRSGGSAHIYGTTVQEASERRVLIVTQSR
jgi:hypothetical protein